MDLTEAVRASIAQFCDKLRRAYPEARWVRTEGMHITLKFIGEANEARAEAIRTALRAVRSEAPADLIFRKVGFFPNELRPRLFWVGIDASANLAEIAREIESNLERVGVAREAREFKPHLTLARFDEPRKLEKLHTAIQSAGAAEFGTVRTNEMYLYRSNLERGGAKYTKIETFVFASM